MLTITEITDLCKSGELEKAYQAAAEMMAADPSDHDSRMAMAISIKALGERAAKAGDIEGLTSRINEFASLRLEEIGEAEMNNRLAWDVRALVLALRESNRFDAAGLDALFDALTGIAFLKPHRYYSILLDALMRVRDENDRPWDAFAEVLDWWGSEYFLPEDFNKHRLNNGAMQTSLAERAYTTAVRSILLAAERDLVTAEDVERLLGELDMLLESHPEFEYTLYHKTRLLKALGRMEEAVTTAREFVKRNQNQFWAWQKLAEVVDEDALKLACYCRALLCKASPESLLKIRRNLGIMLYETGEYAEAKREFEDVASLHNAKGWKLPARVEELITLPWYENTEAAESNVAFYHANLDPTGDFLFGGVPETAILVSKYNPQKQTVSFVTENQRRGFFSTKRMQERFADNQIYRVRFAEEPDGKNPSKVVTIRLAENPEDYEGRLFRRVRSEVNMRPGQTFTFVDGIYIDGTLIRDVAPGTLCDITAVAYYNIKKADWGWRAIAVQRV